MSPFIYLDNAATTAVRPEVLSKMLPFFTEKAGNPSSIHFAGRETRKAVENARRQALAAVNDLMRAYKMLDLKLNDTLLNNIMILGLQHAVYPLEQDADTEKWEIP